MNNYDSDLIEGVEANDEAVENRIALERSLDNGANLWGYTSTGIEAKKAAMSMLSTKTGMYARIPIICKGDNCPYSGNCTLLSYGLSPIGEPCPVETSQIEFKLAGYEKDFNLTTASFTDKILVVELINHDIMLERCKNLILNEDGALVQDVVAGITERGEEFTRPELLKEYEAYDRVLKRRNDIYDLMMATRKSQKGLDTGIDEDSWSKKISDVMEGNIDFIVDVKPEDL